MAGIQIVTYLNRIPFLQSMLSDKLGAQDINMIEDVVTVLFFFIRDEKEKEVIFRLAKSRKNKGRRKKAWIS